MGLFKKMKDILFDEEEYCIDISSKEEVFRNYKIHYMN